MQKIIVSDTSCIGYLIQINCLNLLKLIYGQIIIPEAVNKEILRLEIKGHNLSEFKSSAWIKIYKSDNLSNVSQYQHLLDKGELEAISLAVDLKADLIIIDEKLARIVATSMGFEITGLVGILITAKNMGLISSVKDSLNKVMSAGCRISNKLYNTALKSCDEL
ncbi:MAG: DUF3368 domain-containing protein [Ginsengibacter sp.]